jgi:hypothetical protein
MRMSFQNSATYDQVAWLGFSIGGAGVSHVGGTGGLCYSTTMTEDSALGHDCRRQFADGASASASWKTNAWVMIAVPCLLLGDFR